MRFALLFFLFAVLLCAQQGPLKIVIVEGQDAINDIRQPVTHEPVVEVRNSADEPVPGAAVTFILPGQGPGGVFPNGANTLTVTTDRYGRAVARGIRMNRQTGSFEIRVSASNQGQTASAVIHQTNTSGVSTSGAHSSTKIWIIVAVAAGAAAGGIIAATHGSGGSSSSNAPIVITPGTPTVGGPH